MKRHRNKNKEILRELAKIKKDVKDLSEIVISREGLLINLDAMLKEKHGISIFPTPWFHGNGMFSIGRDL